MNHELRKKDKESSINTSVEVLPAREISSNHWKGKGVLLKLVIINWERISVFSAKRKDTEKLIVQGSRIRMRSLN